VREDILTIREVAEYLKVTEKTVYGLARKRKLPCFKVSRHAKEKF
jgi:excisionase family DNA binding protein